MLMSHVQLALDKNIWQAEKASFYFSYFECISDLYFFHFELIKL